MIGAIIRFLTLCLECTPQFQFVIFLLFVVFCFVVVVFFIITIVNYDGEEDGIGIYTSCFALSRRNLATIWQCDWSYYTIFDLVLRMHPSVPVPSIFL